MRQLIMIISLCTTNGADSHTTSKTCPILSADGLYGAVQYYHISVHFLDTQTLTVVDLLLSLICQPISGNGPPETLCYVDGESFATQQ